MWFGVESIVKGSGCMSRDQVDALGLGFLFVILVGENI